MTNCFENAVERYIHKQFPYRLELPFGFIIGGGEIYRQGMKHAKLMYITEIDCEVEGDAFFPDIDMTVWKKVAEEKYQADAHNQYDYNFVTYARIEGTDAEYFLKQK
jgi:dihydrofolate reductase